jgi:hypothetical protein
MKKDIMRTVSREACFGSLVVLLSLAAPYHVGAANFTVTNLSDSADIGSGSLRRAILDANAAIGPDVITFDAQLTGQTLTLTGEPLNITDDLIINGPINFFSDWLGVRLTIDGSGRDIFRISASRIAVALDRLTLHTPNGGKAIEITGSRNTFTMTNTKLIGNAVIWRNLSPYPDEFIPVPQNPADDGIRIDGHFNRVSVGRSFLVGNEDNFQVGGKNPTDKGTNNIIDIFDSTIELASQDGVVINGNENGVTVQNSTIYANGLLPSDPNDGLDINGEKNAVRIQQVTISGNGEHGLDIEGPGNRVTLENSTITNNGSDGVIIQKRDWDPPEPPPTSTAFIKNSIIAGNRGERSSVNHGGADVFDPYGSKNFISGGYNLVGNAAATAIVGNAAANSGFNGPGDQAGTRDHPIDPRLGPLGSNGGRTSTHALLPGSPAIDAGDPKFVPPQEFDQRGPGSPRIWNARVDIGAFEAEVNP